MHLSTGSANVLNGEQLPGAVYEWACQSVRVMSANSRSYIYLLLRIAFTGKGLPTPW